MIIPIWDLKSQFSSYEKTAIFDCMLAEYLLFEGRYPLTLERAYERQGVSTLEDLEKKQQEELKEHPALQTLYRDIELPLVPVLRRMEEAGIIIDQEALKSLGETIETEHASVKEKILAEFGTPLNLASPAQVGQMLVAKFGVPLKKTASGQFATGERELTPFAPMFPIITDILHLRELAKLTSTYITPLLAKAGEDGRIHTTYNQAGTITGRLSSSNPNLQNIPTTGTFGKQIKSCFIAAPGSLLLALDYSQQELRILAHLTEEPALIEAFATGRDIHAASAAQLFNVPYEQVTHEQRGIAKTINFGVLYGMGSFGLARSLSIPNEQAKAFIDTFYQTFPKIREFYDALLKNASTRGSIATLMGRRRYVFASPKQKFIDQGTRRELMNFPIQGSAADMIKAAMVAIDRDILRKTPQVKLLLQIHDELVFEIATEDHAKAANLSEQIAHVMKTAHPLSVPLEVSTTIGKRWGEANT